MFVGNKNFLAAVALTLLCCGAVGADEESLWEYADASADVVLYINSKQPEKAMDKETLARIQHDQKQALAQSGEDHFFDMKDREVELVVNLRIASMEPFCGTVEGIANISGDLQGDIGKVLDFLKQPDGMNMAPEISKKNDIDFYNLAIPATEDNAPMDFLLVKDKPNRIQFRVNIAPKNKMSQALLSTTSKRSEEMARISGEDVAMACFIAPEKIAGKQLADTAIAEDFSVFLKKVSGIVLTAYVKEEKTYFTGIFTFKAETDAAEFTKKAKDYLSQIENLVEDKQLNPRFAANGKSLEVVIPFKTSDAWDLLSKFTEQDGLPDNKDNADDDDADDD